MIDLVNQKNGEKKKRLRLTRILYAPREKVFNAWTEAKQLKLWWGPHHFTNPVCRMDVRTGGEIYIEMMAPDGMVFPMKGIFHEIRTPYKLVFTSTAFENERGDKKLETLNTIVFENLEEGTLLALEAIVMRSTPEMDKVLDGMEEGWVQSLDKLGKHLGGEELAS